MSTSEFGFPEPDVHIPLREIEPPIRFTNFLDGWALAIAISERADTCGLVLPLMLDDDGFLFDFISIEHDPRAIDEVVDVFAAATLPAEVGALVLFSVVEEAPDVISESDLAAWRTARSAADSTQFVLLDWFIIGQGEIRSMAVLTGPDTPW